MVIVVISKDSINSGWVEKEINASLEKENINGRKFLIPIRIDNVELPDSISDRFTVDFHNAFSLPLSDLVQELDNLALKNINIEFTKELTVLKFTKEVNLDKASLLKSLQFIEKRQGKFNLAPKQIKICDDAGFIELVNRLHHRIDNIENDPDYSSDLETKLHSLLSHVKKSERILSQGVSYILEHAYSLDSIYWFARIIRSDIVYSLWHMQTDVSFEPIEYGYAHRSIPIWSNFGAEEFYSVDDIEIMHIWFINKEAERLRILIPSNEVEKIRTNGFYCGPQRLMDTCYSSVISKCIIPQMLYKHMHNESEPLYWDFEDAVIGIS